MSLSAADVPTSNVYDKAVCPDLTSCLTPQILKKIHYMVADTECDDKALYNISMAKGFQLISSMEKYISTLEERLRLVDFYGSSLIGRVIYSKRRTSIESLIEHVIKLIFR